MIHFAVASGLLLHVAFWGAGAAMLLMPRPWRRFWPVLIVPAGFALQSAVVWAGAHAGLRGTQSYAWGAQVLPAVLLGMAWWRSSTRLRVGVRSWRAAWVDLSRFGVVWAAMGGALALLVLPVAIASRGLTTVSLGSCDAADYAAGARVLLEFARGDRAGFMGLTDVVGIASVDNFFDYWLRLNHFTPSALIAFNGAVLDCAPHELTTLFAAVALAGSVPVVFWSSRALVGYSGGMSLIIAGVYGLSPITWYAFGHVALGQLLAAPAVVLLSWAAVALWRGRLTARRALQFSGVLALGYWLLLGSYNFFLLVCLVAPVTYAAGLALWRRQGSRFVRWLGFVLAPLGACAVVFLGRAVGIAERLSLLQTYDFGWQIPALTAEGWLGMVQGPDLQPWSFLGLRWVLCAGVVGVLVWAMMRSVRQRHRALWLVASIALPVLAAYLYLQWRAGRLGTNASYDAYKLFAVFFPILLPAFCWWVTLRRSRKLHEWLFVVCVGGVVIAFNLLGCGMFAWKLCRPPLMVDGELRQLRKVEAMADIGSVNLLIPDMWSRLWANAFLLRKPHYFLTHTYEARRNTPLRGEWDLRGGAVQVVLPGDARRQLTARFSLVDTRHPAFVRAYIDERLNRHWHPEEHSPDGATRWRWTGGNATVQLDNPHVYPLALQATVEAWSPVPRRASLMRLGGEPRPGVAVGEKLHAVSFSVLELPPGPSTLVLQLDPPAAPVAGDSRPLGLCVFRLMLAPRK